VLNASGYVVARRMSTVSSKVTGKVLEIYVEEGMGSQKGPGHRAPRSDQQPHHPSRCPNAKSTPRAANLNEIEVRLAEAKRNLERNESLGEAAAGEPEPRLTPRARNSNALQARPRSVEGPGQGI